MRGYLCSLALLISIIPMSAFSEDMVSIDKKVEGNPAYVWELDMTVRSEDLVINSIVVNRGECQPQEQLQFPVTVNFGQTGSIAHYLCDPIEVRVDTNKGIQSLTWDDVTQAGVSVTKTIAGQAVTFVTVTSRLNSLKIDDVSINRGQCGADSTSVVSRPHNKDGTMHFGDRYVMLASCNPIEVSVTTDSGTGLFSFNN